MPTSLSPPTKLVDIHRFCRFRCSTSPSLLRNYADTRYWGALTGHTHADCRAVMSVATAVDLQTQDQELLDSH